jgi:N-methylhydantoinase A
MTPSTQYMIGVDVGGTFTDAFMVSSDGTAYSAKAPSTPPDFARGVVAALDEVAAGAQMTLDELLAATTHICHGTTSTLNALVTGDVSTVGFIATKGHGDALAFMNMEGRHLGLSPEQVQDFVHTHKPPPLVPRRLVREVTERVDRSGEIVVDLDVEEARTVIAELVAEGVDGIAVSLLWSFLQPKHERAIRDLVAEIAPDVVVGLSSEVSPRIREFARHCTTIMNTQVSPTLRSYLGPLESGLRERGLRGPLLIMQGSGGTVSAPEAPRRAIDTVGSVLTGGVVGASRMAAELGHENVIATDIGGTTFLAGLVVDGEPVFTRSMVLNRHPVNTTMVRVQAIGSGGGAISWVDDGGNLHVGPRSAGARPGPACYGDGGSEPTNTDANLLLGILHPDRFLGGRKQLHRDLAAEAVGDHVGKPLGFSSEDAAAAIFAVQNGQTADLVSKLVLETGHDPRDFAIYAFGGSGPIHCHAYGADLGVQEILVPLGPTASAFSAYGLAGSDLTATAELSDPAPYPVTPDRVNANFERLERRARDELARQGIDHVEVEIRREIDIRYTLQIAEVATPVADGTLDEEGVAGIIADFEATYARLFGEGSGFSGAGYQLITYRVFAIGRLPVAPSLPRIASARSDKPHAALREHRLVHLHPAAGYRPTAIYDYQLLRAGHVIEGPAVIEAPTTTVVVGASQTGRVDQLGNISIREANGGPPR